MGQKVDRSRTGCGSDRLVQRWDSRDPALMTCWKNQLQNLSSLRFCPLFSNLKLQMWGGGLLSVLGVGVFGLNETLSDHLHLFLLGL